MLRALHTNRRLGRYEVLEELGHGGMATVYRARDTTLERDVALKVLHPHLRMAGEAQARFRREAKTVARLRHPNVLEVYDFGGGEDGGDTYLAAELLTGPTLKAFVESSPRLSAEHAVALLVLVGEALAAAHDDGILHRDVKPENVLLHEGRTVKLTDFGIAHLADAHTMTSTGQVIGSPGHMAPETVQGEEATVATDIFSFGTVMYFVLTGALPFVGKNPHQLLFRVLEGEYPDPLRLEPSIGRELAELVADCLATNPVQRPASMRALLERLRAFLAARTAEPAETLVREAIADPAGARDRVRPSVVRAEIALGDAAGREGRTVEALAHYDRALVLDPGRADVLERVSRISDGGERQARMRQVGVALGAVGLVALLVAVVSYTRPPATFVPDTHRVAAPARLPVVEVTARQTSPTPEPPPPTDTSAAPRPPTPRAPSAPVARGALRTVVFRPEPQNVTIQVDDGPAREFGPSFRSVELPAGPHRVRIVPATECCEVTAFTLEVTPGTGPQVVSRVLPFRPARVYVATAAPADVTVSLRGQVVTRGRTREFLRVPMSSLEDQARISVTAAGYEGYTGTANLRAGEVARTSVTLAPWQ